MQMFFGWLDTNEAKLIGFKLADTLSTDLAKANNKNMKKEMENKSKVMQKVLVQLTQYIEKNNPNFYQKSKLANEFRWRLLDTGHSLDFVEIMTKQLILHMK